MAEIRVCDICGGRIESIFDGNSFKIKRKKFLYSANWETIDICDDCYMQIRQRSIEAHVDKERN